MMKRHERPSYFLMSVKNSEMMFKNLHNKKLCCTFVEENIKHYLVITDMKLTTHMIALDFEHKKDYFPTEMGITIINNDFTVGETYHYYIKHEQLSKKLNENAKTFLEVWKEVQHLFPKDVLIISHSYGTEKKVINQCFKQYNIDKKYTVDDFFDTMWIVPAKLTEVCQSFDIPTDNHHRADADSRMAAEIFCKYMNRFVPNYVESLNEASITGRLGFGSYDQLVVYEMELLRYCKRNSINYNEMLSWLDDKDSERIVKLLNGKIFDDNDEIDVDDFTIETDSDFWELVDCKSNESSLKYIYEMRIFNGLPIIPESLEKRVKI